MEERKYINLGLIDYDKNVFVKLGYLTEKIRLQSSALENLCLNYSGIMGPVLIFPDMYNEFQDNIADDENDFATHLSRLKGFYDNIIYINKNITKKNDNINNIIYLLYKYSKRAL